MIVKLISLVTAIVLGIPVGGVYASADSPSKYLDRLTSANGSSEGMEDETPATVSKAVMGAHGVILNTVDRNANRLEYVASESYDVVKETKDKANPGAGEAKIQDTDVGVGVDSSKEAVVNDPNDVSIQSLDGPEGGFTGESTITYDANGKGSFVGGASTNVVTTKYDGYKEVTKYAHTDNVNDAGIQNGGYGNNKSYSRVVTIPGASSLTVDLTYQTESTSYDWVCAYAGMNVDNVQCSASLTGKLGGNTKTTKSFTVDGDSVTFWFKSDGSADNFYGYYAVVKGLVGSKQNASGVYTAPVDPAGDYDFNGWNTRADGSGEDLGKEEVYSSASQTVYAQWESNWTKWYTVGWKITDDGVLKIRPWEGDTGTMGSILGVSGPWAAPWISRRLEIKTVESTGRIILDPRSLALFYECWNLTSLNGVEDWDTSQVTSLALAFRGCSRLTSLEFLSKWDTSKVTDLGSTFDGLSSLKSLKGLENWDTSKVTDLGYTFQGCYNLTDASAIQSWNLNKVTQWTFMFYLCDKLQKIGIPSIANGGQKLVKNASAAKLSGSLGSRVITEDLQLGPFTWDGLNAEMTTNPDAFNEGHVWVRYTPSWIVTYNTNGGVGSQAGSMMPLSESLTLPESQFLRFGYRFTGWTTQSGPVSSGNPLMLPGTTYKPDNPVDGEKYPLYAQWEKIGGEENQPITGQSGAMPGWVQVNSDNTRNDIVPNQSQNVTFTNKYDPGSTSIQFKFTKLMDGNVPDAGESFQFELIDVTQNKVVQMTTNTGAAVQFQPITYNKTGVYTYYVRETPSNASNGTNSNPNLDYDDHLVEVVVTVTEEDDSSAPNGVRLKATAQITGDTTFRNDSKPASLDITKTVTGVTEGMNDNHRDREFTFKVSLLDRDNQPVTGKTYPTTITNNSESGGNTSPSTSSITFDAKGNATVKLKVGSKLTINGIPAYYKYTITETNIPVGYENISLTNPSGILGANSHVIVDAVNHYTVTPASVSLQAGKTLLAPGGLNQSVNNDEFQFTLCQVTPFTIGPESEPNAESCSGVSETSNDGNGLITFPQLTYDAPGTYQYQIREVKGDALDMTYDSTVYTVTVNVTDDGEGRLVAKVTYTNTFTGDSSTPDPGSKPVWNSSDPNEMGIPVFVNRTTVANRLPVTGGSDIIIAGVVLAMILSCGLMVFLNRGRREE